MRAAAGLPDDQLVAELDRLARDERSATALLIAHLAEFDARRLHLAAGFPSLFAYCTESLRLSEHEAYNRIEAARVARRFPRVIDMLGDGALNLTTVRLLAPRLSDDNQEALLPEASHKSKKQVEELIVRYFPRPDVPSSIRKLPSSRTTAPPAATFAWTAPPSIEAVGVEAVAQLTEQKAPSPGGDEASAAPPAAPLPCAMRRAAMQPLSPDKYEIRFTAPARTCEKLRLAKDLLRHAIPDGDTAEVVDRALTVLLEELARKKFAAIQSTRPYRPSASGRVTSARSSNRHIPAAVRRAVWLRDGGRCAFVGKAAHRCNARGFLEFHHLIPYAAGGASTIDNIQIRCRAHNAYEADLFYGQWEPVSAIRGSRELVPERVAPLTTRAREADMNGGNSG